MSPALSAGQVADLLDGYRFRGLCEDDYQRSIETVLTDAGVSHRREVQLTARDRIDFMVEAVGVEVKTQGSAVNLLRQLGRYAQHPDVEELLVVSTVTRLVRGLPAAVHGVPVTATVLRGPAL